LTAKDFSFPRSRRFQFKLWVMRLRTASITLLSDNGQEILKFR
jgi:hypothetical protein